MLKSVPPRFCQFLGGFAARGFRLRYVLTLIQDTRRFYFLCAALSLLAPFESSESVTKMFRKKFSKKMLDRYAFDWYTT